VADSETESCFRYYQSSIDPMKIQCVIVWFAEKQHQAQRWIQASTACSTVSTSVYPTRPDVRIGRGKVHVWLMTAPMTLIRSLHHGTADHGWRGIPDFNMVAGLTMCTKQRGGCAVIET
jgi:hypothetical protein